MGTHLASLDDVPRLIHDIAGAERLAIDTEFHAERRYLPALYLVQVGLPGGETWILDPLIAGLIPRVADALRSRPWLVHGGHWDMQILQVALGRLPDVVLDTQIGAALVSPWWPAPYAALVRDHLDVELQKAATLSDWSRRPLSRPQLEYAAEDVALLGPLWDRIEDRLRDAGRLEHALAACAEARARVVDPPPSDEAWRDVPAHAALQPQQLAVLQEIAAWRRERALAQNQPERSVLSDGALVELARQQPGSRGELTDNRRLPRSLLKHADELLERITRASRRPEWAWPIAVRRRTPEWRRVAFLEVLALAVGVRDQLAPGLLLPRRTLEDVVLHGVDSMAGWRRDLAGDVIQAAAGGDVALRLDGGDLHLEEAGNRRDRAG